MNTWVEPVSLSARDEATGRLHSAIAALRVPDGRMSDVLSSIPGGRPHPTGALVCNLFVKVG
jgi:hypothetical protein